MLAKHEMNFPICAFYCTLLKVKIEKIQFNNKQLSFFIEILKPLPPFKNTVYVDR